MLMESSRWSSSVVGCVSEWIADDIDHDGLRATSTSSTNSSNSSTSNSRSSATGISAAQKASEQALKQELAWASHLGVPAVLLPTPTSLPSLAPSASSTASASAASAVTTSFPCANYAAAVNVAVNSGAVHGWLRLPACAANEGDADPWLVWNRFRALVDSSPSLHVCLEVGATLPALPATQSDAPAASLDEAIHPSLRRWLGEPVKAAILPTSIFQTNKAGYPTLPRPHQQFFLALLHHRVQFLLSGRPMSTPVTHGGSGSASAEPYAPVPLSTANARGYKPYLSYLRHIAKKGLPKPSDKDEFEAPYYDFLQAPLQPLADNLESTTYETFEKDPVKYELYRQAIYKALCDAERDPNGVTGRDQRVIVITVVGAGRGPLVRKAIEAAEQAGRQVKIYAVEKNPNAVITLRNLKHTLGWGDLVTIVAGDMRSTSNKTPIPKADILVSELLGSFGDNELSPECLDGAQALMKLPSDREVDARMRPLSLTGPGVSIPASYTSFLSPVMSSRLWNAVRSYKEDKWFETPFVVKLFQFMELAPPQAVFRFDHPNTAAMSADGAEGEEGDVDNRRFTRLRFTSNETALLHGFAGYFHCTLYRDVVMSIEPSTHSDGMFSWFPVFFPLRHPLMVSKGGVVELCMWRKVSETAHKVWYEWAVTQPTTTAIHNAGGRSYFIGL
jgi:protein arginine N-methyltransferase 5